MKNIKHKKCPYHSAPGPKGWPLIGTTPALYQDTVGTFRQYERTYGNIVKFPLPGLTGYLVSGPDLIKQVLQEGEPRYTKGMFTDTLSKVFGHGLLTVTGEEWKRQRQFLKPFFLKDNIKKWVPIIVKSTTMVVKQWDFYQADKKPINLNKEMQALMQHVMSDIILGTSIPQNEINTGIDAINTVTTNVYKEYFRQMILRGPLQHIPTPGSFAFKKALKIFDDVINKIISLENSGSGDHLIAMFKRTLRPDTGQPLSDKEIKDQVATFFFAGQETTINALTWTFYFLAQHQDIANKIREEANRILSGNIDNLDINQVDQLIYTRSVIDESLRIRPPAYSFERFTAKDDIELGGYTLENNALVTLPPCVTHMLPDYWEKPERFDPSRFNGGNSKTRHKFSYFPFGAGERICIGKQLALMEMTIIIAMICSKYQFKLANKKPVKMQCAVTLRTTPDVYISVDTIN